MTHPITPPPELRKQWVTEWCNTADGLTYSEFLITRAAQWGWDQREPEIQAVAARRPSPKPPETIEVDGFTYKLIE